MSDGFKAQDRALDGERARRLLRDVSAASGWKIQRVLRITPVHLRPGRRMVVRYEIEGCRPSEAARVHTLFGKLYRGHGGARARGAHEFLAPRLPACVRLAEVLGYHPRRRFLLLAGLEGMLLSGVLRTEAAPARLAAFGAALAAFHDCTAGRPCGPPDSPALRRHDAAAEALVLEQARVRAEIAPWPPPAMSRFAGCWIEVTEALRSGSDPSSGAAPAVVHRDLYPRQVLDLVAQGPGGSQRAPAAHRGGSRDTEVFGLLDLDEASWGEPEIDAGNFAAHIFLDDLQRMGAVTAAPMLAAAFLDAYAEARPVDSARLRVYLAGSLLRLATLERVSLAGQSVLDWPNLAVALVAVVEGVLARGSVVTRRGR